MADADLAVAIAATGHETVIEPASQVIAGPATAEKSRFLEGLHAERLFWRSVAGRRMLPTLMSHLFVVLRHLLRSMPLAAVPMLAGRLIAAMQFGSYGDRYRQLRSLHDSREAAESQTADIGGSGLTIRTDSGDTEPHHPRHLNRRNGLRRSA